jgi:hypothetical protein
MGGPRFGGDELLGGREERGRRVPDVSADVRAGEVLPLALVSLPAGQRNFP